MTKRIAVALVFIGCATDDISPFEAQGGYGGASGAEPAQHVAGAPIATGGNVAATVRQFATGGAVAHAGGTVTTGGSMSTGGASTGGMLATGGVMATATGGTTSTGGSVAAAGKTSAPECRFLSPQPGGIVDLGPCSVYTKGQHHCNPSGECVFNNYAGLDCDGDGIIENPGIASPNCGACGRDCAPLACVSAGRAEWYTCGEPVLFGG